MHKNLTYDLHPETEDKTDPQHRNDHPDDPLGTIPSPLSAAVPLGGSTGAGNNTGLLPEDTPAARLVSTCRPRPPLPVSHRGSKWIRVFP